MRNTRSIKTTIICGGGLAGLSLGIALRNRELPVELHEAGHYPRHRVCGEFIAGINQPLLEELGIAAAMKGAVNLRSTVWHSRKKKVMSKLLPNPVAGISRYLLDERLSQIFKNAGGNLYTGSRVDNQGTVAEGCIWTTGRRPHKSSNTANEWIGLKCHATGLQLQGDLELHFGRHCYIGMSPVSKDRYNVCGLFRLNRHLKGEKYGLLFKYLEDNGLEHLDKRLREGKIDSESFCAISALDYSQPDTDTSYLRLGDSFGLIAPLTGNGMSMAFESAALAVPYIEDWARNKRSWEETVQKVIKKQTQAFVSRMYIGRCLQKFLLHPGGQTVFHFLSAAKLLPFKTLYSLTHHN
jgi:menaquinone-9 beta-reductase